MSTMQEAMEQHGSSSSQSSLELDILHLSQRWEAQRTIRNGDTPGQALRKGSRPALAAIPVNVAAAANPFSLTAQRQKATAARLPSHQKQQPSVRFAVDEPAAASRQPSGDVEIACCLGRSASAAATPAAAVPTTSNRAAGVAGTGGGASCGSPSPYVVFRGRLSFAAEADSARKFDRPATGNKRSGVPTLKRKLLISPGADMSAAFPTLIKPAAKQRRRSLSGACPAWPSRATDAADAADEATAAAAGVAAEEGGAAGAGTQAAGGSSLLNYWSDPLPLPGMAAQLAAVVAAADEDMQDTAASPASSSGAGGVSCSSPVCGTDAGCACGSPMLQPALSPLPGQPCHALPTVDQPDCGFPAITAKTMRDLLTHGAAAFGLDDFAVVDCRYDYEFQGGHLPGALHLTTPEEVSAFLAQPRACSSAGADDCWQRTAVIFHCEFSTERGPRAAKWVRNQDREAHLHDYPALSHPHVFVLQGGYKSFWRSFPELCRGGYTPMDHPDYTEELKVCHNVVKKAWAKTTRTYSRKQRQRRPSYRLRQSTGAAASSEDDAQLERQAEKALQWKDKAHKLGDIIVKQEVQTKELQRQLAALQAAQAAALAAATADGGDASNALSAAELAAMRQQLVLAQAQLRQQSQELEAAKADYKQRQSLLKEAAGTARREVLALQAANTELQAMADRLQAQNEALGAQLRAAHSAALEGAGGSSSAGPSPAKRHTDAALLQAMLRKQDGELSLLREDSASQQEELMRTLTLLQARLLLPRIATPPALPCHDGCLSPVCSLEGQLAITQDELTQKDAHLEVLREKLEEQQQALRQLRKQLAAAEQAAATATAAAAAAAGGPGSEEVAQLQAEAAALQQRWQQAEAEVEVARGELAAAQFERSGAAAEAQALRQQLQQRDAEVAQLRLQLPDLRGELLEVQRRADASSSEVFAVRDELRAAQAQLERQQEEAAQQAAQAQWEAAVQLEQQQAEAAAETERLQRAAVQEAAELAAAVRQEAEEVQAALRQQLEEAAAARAELEGKLRAAAEDRAEFAEQLAAAAAAMQAAEEQMAAHQQTAQENEAAVREQAAELGRQAAEELAAVRSAATEQQAALQQLQEAEGQLEALRRQLGQAEERQAALQRQLEESRAGLQQQLAAVAAERDSSQRQLHRLQSDVTDAELLLASFLGGAGSSASSVFGTPAASPKRPASAEGSSEDVAPDVACAVQWLQQTQQAQQAEGDGGSAPPSARAASSSRLCRRIQGVLLELQRLQQQQQQQQRAQEGGSPAGQDSGGNSPAAAPAEPAEEARVAPGAGAKLPLLSPVQSHSSAGALIAADYGAGTPAARGGQEEGESEAAGAMSSHPLTPGISPPTAASSKAKSRLQPQQRRRGRNRDGEARRNGQGGSGGGRKVLEAVVRTAGLAGLVGAVALQVLQHARPR
ncbi:hypothetical protein CHLNCDRAFT_141868 [Chlorella variabilis]|uniref:protein-tyrosine-phosphatase n=1 Tax=Chlorella variabilis TaxID=554065 RepID=E1Z783_CHLVA|nr:hypothetical protein CHLNCDRAFT_141868 [Chlorella variabilis]EFN57871.1 hypothetical protein CHLNCDRAFT_141868 [Chlorella variabilis]|eukprot:XP_005849973.1 hypothetical protein CHLNCDRAFT_141868 [Chlorella variabilis]